MNYQKLILVGNATVDAQHKTSKAGDVTYTSFSLAVNAGKDKATFFPVTVFGKQAEAVAKYVTKGQQVLVEGRIDVSDEGRFNVVATDVRFGYSAKKPEPAPEGK